MNVSELWLGRHHKASQRKSTPISSRYDASFGDFVTFELGCIDHRSRHVDRIDHAERTLSLECSSSSRTRTANGSTRLANAGRHFRFDLTKLPSTPRKFSQSGDALPSKSTRPSRRSTIVIGVSAMINRIPAWMRESKGYVPMGRGEAPPSLPRCVFRDEGSALNPGRTSLSCYRAWISRGRSIPAPVVPASDGCRC